MFSTPGEAGFIENPNDLNIGERRGGRRFDDDRVACDESRADLVGHQRYWKIPRQDGATHANGLLDDQAVPSFVEILDMRPA